MSSKALPMVYKMKRLFRALMGVTEGISVHDKPSTGEHFVRVDFSNSGEAARFYHELSSVDPVRVAQAETWPRSTTSTFG